MERAAVARVERSKYVAVREWKKARKYAVDKAAAAYPFALSARRTQAWQGRKRKIKGL